MNEEKVVSGSKHLDLDVRKTIESMLDKGMKLNEIAKTLNRDPRGLAKEIRRNRSCKVNRRFLFSPAKYQNETCSKLDKFPFTCNGCTKKPTCRIKEMFLYDAETAQNRYEYVLVDSRTGLNFTVEEYTEAVNVVKVGLEKGQSLHHIYETNPTLMGSDRTMYRLIENESVAIINLDLRRKVSLKKRASNAQNHLRLPAEVTFNRTYSVYIAYLAQNPSTSVVQMDLVAGSIKSSCYLLNLHFTRFRFMVTFKIPSKQSNEVTKVFNRLKDILGVKDYKRLFQTILTDRGSEFSDLTVIEVDCNTGEIISKVFYCDPQASNQKAEIEENHTLLRYMIPKGTNFDELTDQNINDMSSNLNSYHRKVSIIVVTNYLYCSTAKKLLIN